MHNSRNLILTASILGAVAASSVLPAMAFSFVPQSGSLSVTTGTKSFFTADLYSGAGQTGNELVITGKGTISSFAAPFPVAYLGTYTSGAFILEDALGNTIDQGFLNKSVGFSFSEDRSGNINFLSGPNAFTDTMGNPAGFSNNFTLTTTGSAVNVLPGSGNVVNGTGTFSGTAPVPEASTVVSFGLLLMGGGLLACRKQKSAAKAA